MPIPFDRCGRHRKCPAAIKECQGVSGPASPRSFGTNVAKWPSPGDLGVPRSRHRVPPLAGRSQCRPRHDSHRGSLLDRLDVHPAKLYSRKFNVWAERYGTYGVHQLTALRSDERKSQHIYNFSRSQRKHDGVERLYFAHLSYPHLSLGPGEPGQPTLLPGPYASVAPYAGVVTFGELCELQVAIRKGEQVLRAVLFTAEDDGRKDEDPDQGGERVGIERYAGEGDLEVPAATIRVPDADTMSLEFLTVDQ